MQTGECVTLMLLYHLDILQNMIVIEKALISLLSDGQIRIHLCILLPFFFKTSADNE